MRFADVVCAVAGRDRDDHCLVHTGNVDATVIGRADDDRHFGGTPNVRDASQAIAKGAGGRQNFWIPSGPSTDELTRYLPVRESEV